ncbi:MAG: hypothetical protein J6T06_10485, partial [Victivallales bacterium]|nr:hypothetical protein [Victivallales bacterium]
TLLDEMGKLSGVISPKSVRVFHDYELGLSNVYVFSTHRDAQKITMDDFPLVPHPEEVLVALGGREEHKEHYIWAKLKGLEALSHQNVLPEKMPPSLDKLKFVFDFPWGKEGKNYWNWRACINIKNTSHRDIFLFYGDSVSEERLATILDICENYMKYRR